MNISDFKQEIKLNLQMKNYRMKSKLSQRDLAKIMNITQAQYQRLESGISMLSANQILFLCSYYRCTPNDLLGFRGEHIFYTGQMDDEV